MSGTNLSQNYFGSGAIAARPATPLIANGASAIYFATDTSHVYMWSGTLAAGSWKLII
jgi:hypothetical protein